MLRGGRARNRDGAELSRASLRSRVTEVASTERERAEHEESSADKDNDPRFTPIRFRRGRELDMGEERRVLQPVAALRERGDEQNEEGVCDETVRDRRSEARTQAEDQHARTDHEDRRHGRVHAGLEERRKADVEALARRRQPGDEAGARSAEEHQRQRDACATEQPNEPAHWSDDEVVEAPSALFITYGGDLARGEHRDEDGDREERHAEVGLRRLRESKTAEGTRECGRAREQRRSRSRDVSLDRGHRDDAEEPADRGRTDEADGEARWPDEPSRARGARALSQDAGPEIAALRHHQRGGRARHSTRQSRQERLRLRITKRPHLLDPADRAQPSKPCKASGRVGDHPDEERRSQRGAREHRRLASRRADLTGYGTEGYDHRGALHLRDSEEKRAVHREALTRDRDRRDIESRSDREHRGHRDTETDERLQGASALGRLAREEQLPATRLFVAPQQTGAGQQTPDTTDECDHDEHPPHREARDRLCVIWLAEKDRERLEGRRHQQALPDRRIADEVRLRARNGEEPEHETPARGPAKRAARDVSRDEPPHCAPPAP